MLNLTSAYKNFKVYLNAFLQVFCSNIVRQIRFNRKTENEWEEKKYLTN